MGNRSKLEKLQPNDNWLKFKDNLGFQIEDYSDIEKKNRL